jgi:hypothetical protein
MDIVKASLIFITTILFTGCSGDSRNNSADVIFSEHLPAVNPDLNSDSRSGIWMVYRIREIISENQTDGIVYKNIKTVSNEISVIDKNENGNYFLPFCDNYILNYNKPYEIEINNDGYSYVYNIPPHYDFTSKGRLDISFINNQKIIGSGKTIVQNNESIKQSRNTKIYAIKISDATDFNSSNEITYSNYIETELNTDIEFSPTCLGITNEINFYYDDNILMEESRNQQINQSGIGADGSTNMLIDKLSSQTSDDLNHKGFRVYYFGEQGIDTSLKNVSCSFYQLDCLNSNELNINITQNNSFGISFIARLESSDGGFLDAQVSATINPTESVED